jgi:molybdenum cofactor biosynthesis protein MoaC
MKYMSQKLSHLDSDGKIKMIDVSEKGITERTASAQATVILGRKVFKEVECNTIAKGDVLSAAKLAGINAAKKTSWLIPLCHNIFLSNVDLTFMLNSRTSSVKITSIVKSTSQTGVEMEALTAAGIAALTIYDMCKSLSKNIEITDIHLLSKSGGKSGNYKRKS